VNLAAIGMLLNISKGEQISTTLIDKEIIIRRRARRNMEIHISR
jgi:hypothetical protein